MPLRWRLGRIGSACAGEPCGGTHRRRWLERMKETAGGGRPDACKLQRSAAVHVAGGLGKV
eukprot:1421336-Pleurochrysis_carterae.AAC.1